MTARYLVRLDDACETMDRERWAAVERLLDGLGIRPIVAVVPDNRDPDLMRGPADPAFWDRVRQWQARGWTIAMHGLHHVCHPIDRRQLVVPFHDRSEFAGLGDAAQTELLARSWALFARQGVCPTVWVAPGHAFDRGTVRALKEATPIRVISDGLSMDQFSEAGFTWLPQQLWKPERRRRGLWTICLHPNSMDEAALAALASALSQPFFRERVCSVADLEFALQGRNFADHIYWHWFFARDRAVVILLPAYRLARRVARVLKPA